MRAQVSNGVAPWWPSQFGPDDQIGMLNHIDEVFATAHNIDPSTPVLRPVSAGAPSGVMPAQKAEAVNEAEAKRKAARTAHA